MQSENKALSERLFYKKQGLYRFMKQVEKLKKAKLGQQSYRKIIDLKQMDKLKS